jgi:zinc/manganese transport system substrate-binding protein
MRLIAFALIAAIGFGGVAHGSERLRIVASFSILADLVREVGGEAVGVTSLVGPAGDTHAYQPTPADARTLAEADLVMVNGLGFEGWIDRLIAASGYAGPIVRASRGVKARAAAEHEEHAHDHGDQPAADPHAWQSVPNALAYVRVIQEGLSDVDPAHAADYRRRAAEYGMVLETLDREIRSAVATLPPDRRTVITSHDAFGYYAAEYGLRFLAPVGLSTEAEPSAGAVAALVRQIKETQARALFVENVTDPRLVEQIARETGAVVGGELYSDALSPADGPAPTYVAMMRHNTRVITSALGS